MATIVYAWELGGGQGHLRRQEPLARELARRGHRVLWAAGKFQEAHAVAAPLGQTVLPAPLAGPPPLGMPEPPLTYYENWFRFDLLEPAKLYGLARGWRDLLRCAGADLLIADYAPAAMLGARAAGVPTAMIGTGFGAPPLLEPLPAFAGDEAVPQQRLVSGAQRALAGINAVLADLGVPALRRACDLFDVDENFLTTYPELDHYGARTGVRYWSALLSESAQEDAAAPDWPQAPGKKVFAYLSAHYAHIDNLLKTLQLTRWPTLVYAAGLSSQLCGRYETEALRFAPRALPLQQVAAACDVAVCHAGHGTVCGMLLAGKPLFMLPQWREQAVTARRVEALGAGISHEPERGDHGPLVPVLKRVAGEAGYTAGAQAFAARHREPGQAAVLAAIADRCGELAGK